MPSIPQKLRSSIPFTGMEPSDRQALLFCIGLAFVFWLILNLSQEYEIAKEVRLTYDAGPERVVAGSPPEQIPVQIAGSGWALIWESLRGGAINVTVNLGDAPDQMLSSSLLQQQINRQLSSGELEVASMGYESESILTTPLSGKRVPLRSNLAVDFVAGYFAPDGVQLTPDSVTVSGATDALAEIFSWPTETVPVRRVQESTSVTVPLAEPPPGVTLSYSEVEATIIVDAFIEQQHRVPVILINAPAADSSRVFPASVSVTATIPQSAYGNYKPSDFRVEADLSRMEGGERHNTLPLKLVRVPDEIRTVTFSPRAVEYYLYRKED